MEVAYYRNQCVRDLAWVIASPPLISSLPGHNNFLQKEYFEKEYKLFSPLLKDLDSDPLPLLNHIKSRNTHLLGKYFETLVEYWIKESSNKELITHNLQVFKGKQTIGEFDFIYRDLESNKVIHLEAAGKFYIARENRASLTNFIGPNSIDNLDLKINKILNDQIALSKTDEGRDTLKEEGINKDVQSLIFLKGYLFYYSDLFFNNLFIAPPHSEEKHKKGWWIYEKDKSRFFEDRKGNWIIIKRMNWISKIFNPSLKEVLSGNELINNLANYFNDNHSLLIAEVSENEKGILEETSRGFVVSNSWINN